MTEEQQKLIIDLLIDTLESVYISHSWMLKSILYKEKESREGNFSDDLKHSIAIDDLLKFILNEETS